MTRTTKITLLVVVLVTGLGAGAVAVFGGEQQTEAPAVSDPTVPEAALDLGEGERLLLVVEGVYPTTEEAVAANEELAFAGHLQGFYPAPVSQFEGLEGLLSAGAGEIALVTAFRTDEGAAEFLRFLEGNEVEAELTPRVLNLGGVYVGLGQEANPDGSGPLTGPIPGVTVPLEDGLEG